MSTVKEGFKKIMEPLNMTLDSEDHEFVNEDTTYKKNNISPKKLISYAGFVLMIISLIFIARRFMTYGIDFSLLTSPLVVIGVLAVALLEGLGIIGASFNYRALIKNVSGVQAPMKLAMDVYTTSNLYKYIPGGVMYVLGRNRLALEEEEITHGQVTLATIIEGATIVVGAIVVIAVFAFDISVRFLSDVAILPMIFIGIAIAVLILIPIVFYFRDHIKNNITKLTSKMEKLGFEIIIKRIGFGILLMFLLGLTFTLTLTLLGQPMTLPLGLSIVGLFLLAWLAGFLTPGAPSGLGIREAVMLLFLGAIVNVDILLAAMVMHRVLTVVGDLVAYAIALGYKKLA